MEKSVVLEDMLVMMEFNVFVRGRWIKWLSYKNKGYGHYLERSIGIWLI